MKILYDHQAFYADKTGGVTRYFNEIIRNMPDEATTEIVALTNMNIYVDDLLPHALHLDYPRNSRVLAKLLKTANQMYSLSRIRRDDYDVLHVTNNEIYYLDKCRRPVVTTIHDMIYEWHNQFPKLVEWRKIQCEKADHIITVSENTRKELLERYPKLDPAKVSTIYHGASLIPFTRQDNGLGRYLLYVGKRTDYKNFDNLARAAALLMDKDRELKLVCTGAAFTTEERKMLQSLRIADRTQARHVSDTELYNLYANAQAFVFPSRYEGFGIPILESWHCQCPVVLTRSSCFPEIGQEACGYFNPDDIEEMAQSIADVIYDPAHRQELIRLGNERLKKFSWQKTAQQTLEVYKSLV